MKNSLFGTALSLSLLLTACNGDSSSQIASQNSSSSQVAGNTLSDSPLLNEHYFKADVLSDSNSANSYSVKLTWHLDQESTDYALIRKNLKDGTSEHLGQFFESDTYVDESIHPDTDYQYTLVSIEGYDSESLIQHIPVDLVVSGEQNLDSDDLDPNDTEKNTVTRYSRIFFKDGSTLLIPNEKDFNLDTKEIHCTSEKGCSIKNALFPSVAQGVGGASAKSITISVLRALGVIRVLSSAQDGSSGNLLPIPGPSNHETGCDLEAGPNGLSGFGGGNAATLLFSIQDKNSDYHVTLSSNPGLGGTGSDGGAGGGCCLQQSCEPSGHGGSFCKCVQYQYATKGAQGNQGPSGIKASSCLIEAGVELCN